MQHLVELFRHVHGDPDRAALVGDRARHRLADPPRGVGRELVAAAVVELLHRPDQSQRALLDQVQEGEAAAHVALGDRHHEAQVGLDHLLLGRHVPALDALGEAHLFGGAQQRHAPDRAQVQAQRVEARLRALELGGAQLDIVEARPPAQLDDLVEVHGSSGASSSCSGASAGAAGSAAFVRLLAQLRSSRSGAGSPTISMPCSSR